MKKTFIVIVVVILASAPLVNYASAELRMPSAEFVVPLKGPKMPVISEGWKYSDEEKAIHGVSTHFGIDFEAPRGTPVYAAADGFAVGSFHNTYLVRLYKNKGPIGFGLGNFVQVWHPDLKVYTSYSHLSRIVPSIPKYPPRCTETGCNPEVTNLPPDFSERNGKYVKQGEIIGFVGDTGLSWGYDEGPGNRPDPKKFPSWDDTHLHFEVYDRDPVKFFKQDRYDPFGWYGELGLYGSGKLGPNALWKLDKLGRPLFAR